MKIESIFALTFRGFSSAGSEHLPYKQGVGGSIPSTPTNSDPAVAGFFSYVLLVYYLFIKT